MRSSLSNTASSKKVYTVNDKNKKKNSAIENPMLQVYDIFTAERTMFSIIILVYSIKPIEHLDLVDFME
jgi:hypothetical protein